MKPVEGELPSEKVGDARCLTWGSKLGFWSHLEWSVHDDSWNTAFLDSKVSLRVH